MLSNASNGSLDEITKSIFAILYNKEYKITERAISYKVPEAKLKEYEGEYEIRPELHVVMSVKNGEPVASLQVKRKNLIC